MLESPFHVKEWLHNVWGPLDKTVSYHWSSGDGQVYPMGQTG